MRQLLQLNNVDAPVTATKVPAEQLMQPDDPVADWNVPTPQLVQTLAPDAEYFPAAQLKHVAAPVVDW